MYRVVLAEHSRPVQAKFIEILGFYNPRSKELDIKLDNINAWVKKGAKLTPSVESLIARANDPEGFEKKRSEARAKKSQRKATKRAASKDAAASSKPNKGNDESAKKTDTPS